MQKKALITGITSQDGAYLSQHLLKKGYKVVGLIRSSQNPYFNGLKYLGIDSEIEYEIGDLLDGIGLNRILYKHKFDEIYNSIYTSDMENHFEITGENQSRNLGRTSANFGCYLINENDGITRYQIIYRTKAACQFGG